MAADETNTRHDRGICLDLRRSDRASVRSAVIEGGDALALAAAAWCESASPALGRASVYLIAPQGSGVVPTVSWELRALFGGADSELIAGASGALSKFSAWTSEGSIVHVSGRGVLGFELWAKSSGASIPCTVRFVVGGTAGAPWYVENGELV